jgi:tetratricopeptide (TPR) repeat protein
MPDHFISRDAAERDLFSAATYVAERIKSADGHAEAMGAIIPIYLAKGEVDMAASLANEIGEPFSRDKLLISVAEKCAELDDDEYAMQLVDAIEDQGMHAQAFERIGLVKAGKGETDAARRIADTMVHPDFVLAGIAVRQAADGNDEEARSTLESIDFPTARASALEQIASAAIETDKVSRGVEMLERSATAADEIEHDEEKIRAFCDIGNLFIAAGRNDKAVETFDHAHQLTEVLGSIHRDYFYVACALGFLHAGSLDLADRTLDLVTDKTQMASALLGFSREYWSKGEKDEAIETLDEADEILKSQREMETRDSRARNALMTSIAVQFAGFGKTERGIEVAQQNLDPDEQMNGFAQIAQILAIQKEDDLARQTLNLIPEDANRVFALISMADAKEKLEDKDAALALFNEAASLAETVPQLASRSSVLNELAMRFALHGDLEKARQLSIENLAVILSIRDESTQAVTLASLSGVYERAGIEPGEKEFKSVEQLLRRM